MTPNVAGNLGAQSSSRRSSPVMPNNIANACYAAVGYGVAALSYGYDEFGDILSIFSFTCATLLLVPIFLGKRLENL
jgi:hypothetical protein